MADYICKKGLALKKYDDDGFATDEYIDIEIGDVYHKVDSPLFISTAPAIRLEDDDGNWIEIQPETFREYFDEAAQREEGQDGTE